MNVHSWRGEAAIRSARVWRTEACHRGRRGGGGCAGCTRKHGRWSARNRRWHHMRGMMFGSSRGRLEQLELVGAELSCGRTQRRAVGMEGADG